MVPAQGQGGSRRVSSYHRSQGKPNWVSWHLAASWLGSSTRQDDFRADASLPTGWYQVQASSYTGSGFDRMWLQMMVQHHEGAVEMAKAEQADGENRAATRLAASIEESQTAEIARMQEMLG